MERIRTGYLSLGSNVGDRAGHLRLALARLDRRELRVAAASSLYETEHVGPEGERRPRYLNAVAVVRTRLGPEALLQALLHVERLAGRDRGSPHAPRTLDLDLLLLGDLRRAGERLTLPHPRLTARAFVLAPLAEVAPGLRLPGGRRAADWLAAPPACGQDVRRLPEPLLWKSEVTP